MSSEGIERVLATGWSIDPNCIRVREALRDILAALPPHHFEYAERGRLFVLAEARYTTQFYALGFKVAANPQPSEFVASVIVLGPEVERLPIRLVKPLIMRLLQRAFAKLDGLDEYDAFAAECSSDCLLPDIADWFEQEGDASGM